MAGRTGGVGKGPGKALVPEQAGVSKSGPKAKGAVRSGNKVQQQKATRAKVDAFGPEHSGKLERNMKAAEGLERITRTRATPAGAKLPKPGDKKAKNVKELASSAPAPRVVGADYMTLVRNLSAARSVWPAAETIDFRNRASTQERLIKNATDPRTGEVDWEEVHFQVWRQGRY